MPLDSSGGARTEIQEGWLGHGDVRRLLTERGVVVPRGKAVRDSEEAREVAQRLQSPMVLKLISPALLHKSDIGGVRLGLLSATAVGIAADELIALARSRNLEDPGLLLEEQSPPGVELIIGAIVDINFGPVVAVGLGGIWTEALGDVTFAMAPLSSATLGDMLASLRAWPVLTGGRGREPVDLAALKRLLLVVGGEGGLILGRDIDQIDLNPVIARSDGVVVVDARIRRGASRPSEHLADRRQTSSLDYLFKPRRVGLIGASPDRYRQPTNPILQAYHLSRQGADLFCVHPAAERVKTVHDVICFPSLEAAGGYVDLLTIGMAAAGVPEVVRHLGDKVRFVHIATSADTDLDSRSAFYDAVNEAASSSGVRVLGPNCLGVHCPAGAISFVRGASMEQGRVSVISQSGGFAADIITGGETERLKFAKVASIGDAIDIDAVELLGYFLDDPDTETIGLYLETARGARRLYEEITARPVHKPIVILKGGLTDAGGRAAASHTGALAGDARLWRIFEMQAGVAVTSRVQDLFAILKFFDRHSTALLKRPTAALVMGGGGGFSVQGADALATIGVSVPALSDRAQTRLRDLFGAPIGYSYANPLDVALGPGGQGNSYAGILEPILQTDSFSDVVMHTPISNAYRFGEHPEGSMLKFAESVAETARQFPALRFSLVLNNAKSQPGPTNQVRDYLADAAVPVFDCFDDVAVGIRAASLYAARWAAG
jgi:acyl-CoA synthetase (NDP forming)